MNRYALIVGISQYQNRSLPPLSKPAVSAEAVAKLLETHGNFQEVRRLPANWLSADRAEMGNTLLTAAELSGEIKRLLNEQAIGGEVLIYFSGHGFVVSDNLGGSEAYLAASDTQIGVADNQVIWQQNGIRLRSLAEQFAQANFSSLVMLLDCCHSGSLIESGVVQQALANASSRDYVLIAACRGFEKAYEGAAETSHSNFTSALLAGLAREQGGENGLISSDRLFDHLSQTLKGTGQQPIRLGLGRSIAIVTYPPSEAVPAETSFNPANPYVGLAAFESFQADYFFGRDGEIRSLLERLDPLQTPARRFLAVIGPSGSGKSSLVKAGLVPALVKDALPESSQWQIEPLKPGAFPLAALNAAIAKYADAQPHLLVIDQFEELFTLCQSEEEQRAFLALLNQQVTRVDRQARVVITMRADFLDRCARYQESADLINQLQPTTFMVTPLTDDKLAAQLGQAIEEPATRHGVKFQSGLAARMSSDVRNQLGAMPLLQYALTELWNHCIPDGAAEPCLTWAGYEAIGGVRGALQRRADSLYASLTESDRDLLKKLVMELVQIGDGGEVSRRRAERQELWVLAAREQVDRLLDRLTSERFLMVDGETVEVAHEALLSEAPQIRGWIEENRENLRQRDRFERDCREWQEQERSDFYLLNPGKLAAVEEWVANTNPVLSTVESEFVGESVGKRDRETKAQLEQERRLREAAEARELVEIEKKLEAEGRAEAEVGKAKESQARVKAEEHTVRTVIGAGALVFALLFTIGVVKYQATVAETSALRTSGIKTLIESSKIAFESDKQLESLMLAVNALKHLKDAQSGKVPSVLRQIVSQLRERNRLSGHRESVTSVAVDSKSQTIASSDNSGIIKLWDYSGKLKATNEAHKEPIISLKFSPSGNILASASLDRKVRLWHFSSKTLKPFQLFEKHKTFVYDVSFNPNGKTVVSCSDDGQIILWDVNTGQIVNSTQEKGRVIHIDFSPDQRNVALTSLDGNSVKLWDTIKNTKITVGKHPSKISFLRFNPSGAILASSDYGGNIKLWDSANASLLASTETHHKGYLHSVAFDPDGKLISSTGEDGTIGIWSLKQVGKRINIEKKFLIKGHRNDVTQSAFLNEKELVSVSDDMTVRIWNIADISLSDQITPNQLLQYGCNSLFNYAKNVATEEIQVCSDVWIPK